MSERLSVAIQQIGKRAIVEVAGEIDLQTAPELARALDGAIVSGALEVWLDLRSTDFIDSTGLRAVLTLRRRLVERNRPLAIICPRGPARRVFEAAGVDRVLPLHATVTAAQRAS
jgi:anti-sigma B factor antagonist